MNGEQKDFVMSYSGTFAEDCQHIRQQAPVIHNITNYVAMNVSANALLALGASPLMSSEPAEMEDILQCSSALVINIGCLEERQIEAMHKAARIANAGNVPWVLDPVGVGISALRTSVVRELVSECHPNVIRGNAAEITFLSGSGERPHGVDCREGVDGIQGYAALLARESGAVISVSGDVDIITDGKTVIRLYNGSPLMSAVTAMGCTASAVTAAFLSVDSDSLQAAANAMAMMGLAGQRAEAVSAGPGTFSVNFIDALSTINPAQAQESIRYEQAAA